MRFFRTLLAACCTMIVAGNALALRTTVTEKDHWSDLKLIYRQPARQWSEAVPIGNGRLGAMVYADVLEERLQLSAGTLQFGDLIIRMHYGDKEIPTIAPIVIDGWKRSAPIKHGTPRSGNLRPSTIAMLAEDFDDSSWEQGEMSVSQGSTIVFRTAFELTQDQIDGGLVTLSLAPLDGRGIVHVNGTYVLQTGSMKVGYYKDISSALRAGHNTIALAVSAFWKPCQGLKSAEIRQNRLGLIGAQEYIRTLELDTATAKTSYWTHGTYYRSEVFVSSVDDMLIYRIKSDEPGSLSLDIGARQQHGEPSVIQIAEHDTELVVNSDHPQLTHILSSTVSDDHVNTGVTFMALVHTKVRGGTIETTRDWLKVRNADEVEIYLTALTDADERWETEAAASVLQPASLNAGFEQLQSDHVAAHQEHFRRVGLDLDPYIRRIGFSSGPVHGWRVRHPTDRRLHDLRFDRQFYELYFQYGRYLFMCAARGSGKQTDLEQTPDNVPSRGRYVAPPEVQQVIRHVHEKDGDKAFEQLRLFLEESAPRNLLSDGPPLQPDTNFAATAAIADMLVQSRDDIIEILPALPDAWPNGMVSGLRATGGLDVDIEWRDEKPTEVVIRNAVDIERSPSDRIRIGIAGTYWWFFPLIDDAITWRDGTIIDK